MQKISLLPSNSMQQPSLGIGRKNVEFSNKRFKVTSTGAVTSGKTVKTTVSESRALDRNNRNRLETKSSLIRKPFVSKADNRVKRNLDANQKNKAVEKTLDKTRTSVAKKESIVKKTTSLKKEVAKKLEVEKRALKSKFEKTNTTSKDKSSVDSEFKKKFNSIVPKNANESKNASTSSQRPKTIVEKATKSSIFNTKLNEKHTLQIETWGPAQAPKPLFNVSKAVMRTYVTEKKSVPEKIFPQPENVMRRISKQMTAERSLEKTNAPKIWKF